MKGNQIMKNRIAVCMAMLPLLGSFWLLPKVQAVSPPPDGGYSGANTAEGTNALFSLTTGNNNTAIGSEALLTITSGNQNTALGAQAQRNGGSVFQNTAIGFQALTRNSTNGNTATGWRALFTNTTGSGNTADGYGALYSNIGGSANTGSGYQALYGNITGSRNTAVGYQANNGGGNDNTAVGSAALGGNVSSTRNTALGSGAMLANMGGSQNTATGFDALAFFTTGSNNTANGVFALGGFKDPISPPNGNNNTAIGASALVGGRGEFDNNTVVGAEALPLDQGGHDNIAIGYRAGANLSFGDNNIEIGNPGDPLNGDGNTIRIGETQIRTFIAGIYGVNEGGTILPVYINSNGQLGTQPPASARRFKSEIKPMDHASESILGLDPVTFQYKSDQAKVPQFGLIAEQVAEVNPDLVIRDKEGGIYSVRYEAVNAMLLNEFLKEHRKVEKQDRELQKQAAMIAQQQKQIEWLSAGLQKVTARLDVNMQDRSIAVAAP
jgi:trimeric autotransporter adhesin